MKRDFFTIDISHFGLFMLTAAPDDALGLLESSVGRDVTTVQELGLCKDPVKPLKHWSSPFNTFNGEELQVSHSTPPFGVVETKHMSPITPEGNYGASMSYGYPSLDLQSPLGTIRSMKRESQSSADLIRPLKKQLKVALPSSPNGGVIGFLQLLSPYTRQPSILPSLAAMGRRFLTVNAAERLSKITEDTVTRCPDGPQLSVEKHSFTSLSEGPAMSTDNAIAWAKRLLGLPIQIISFPQQFVQEGVVCQTEMLKMVSTIIQAIAKDMITPTEKEVPLAPKKGTSIPQIVSILKATHSSVDCYRDVSTAAKTEIDRFDFGELRASFFDRDDDGLHPGDRVCLVPDILVLEVKVLGVTAYRIEFAIMNKRLCKKPEDLIIRAKDRRRPQVSTGSQTKNVVAGNSTSGELLQKKCDRLKVNLQQWEENIAEMKANNEEILFYDAPVPLEEIPEKFLERLVKNPAFLCNDGSYCESNPGIYAWKKIREECLGSLVSTKKRVRDFGKFHELWLELDVSELERQIGVDPGWRAELEVAMYVDRRATSSHPNYMLGMTSTAEKLINQIKWGDQGLPRDLTNRAKDWEKEHEDDWDIKKGFITCALAKGELEPKRDVCLDLVDKGNCSGLAWELHKFEDGSLVDVPLLTQLMLLKEHKGQGWEEVMKEYQMRNWMLSSVRDICENPSTKRFELEAGSSKYEIVLSHSEMNHHAKDSHLVYQHLEWQLKEDLPCVHDSESFSSEITPEKANVRPYSVPDFVLPVNSMHSRKRSNAAKAASVAQGAKKKKKYVCAGAEAELLI